MPITINRNPIEIRPGMTAQEILQAAGFSDGHHLALEMPDDALHHLNDNEIVKPSPGDTYVAVPLASKGC